MNRPSPEAPWWRSPAAGARRLLAVACVAWLVSGLAACQLRADDPPAATVAEPPAAETSAAEATPADEIAVTAADSATLEGEAAKAADHGDDSGKSSATSSEDHGKAGEDHGKDDHGKSDGQAAADGHGEAGHGEAGHDDHGGHDPYDLGANNLTASGASMIDFRFDLAIYTLVVFALLLTILGKFAWRPITEGLDKRESRIARLIEEAEQGASKAQAQLAQYEQKLAAAQREAEDILGRARKAAQETADQIVSQARDTAQREKDRALSEISTAKNEALGEVTQKSVDIALGLAGSIVRRQLTGEDHAALIQEALQRFPAAGRGPSVN